MMSGQTLVEKLKRWGYSREINDRVAPILKIAEQNNIKAFDRAICEFSRLILQELETQKLDGKTADDLFMVLDLYIAERDLRDDLSEEAQELVLEGLHLHHLGDVHGPDLGSMRQLIERRLLRAP